MARNDFQTMKANVTAELHDSSLSTRSGDWINTSIQIIHNKTNWLFLQAKGTLTTVASQQEYNFTDIASDIDKILYIIDPSPGSYLREVAEIELRMWDPENDEESEPRAYYVRDQVVGIWPTSNDIRALTVGYKKTLTDLTGDSDTPDIPFRWTDVIEAGALMLGHRYLKGPGDADFVTSSQYFDSRIADMLRNMQGKPNKRHRMRSPQERTVPHILRIPNTEFD